MWCLVWRFRRAAMKNRSINQRPTSHRGVIDRLPALRPPSRAGCGGSGIGGCPDSEQALHGTTVEVSLPDGLMIELETPPLAGDGWRLRLEGVAPGGRDHFLHLRVVTDEGLRIDGLRVHYRLELFPPDAALGCAVDVPTLDGAVTLQVPPGSSSGRLLRLRGRGLEWDGRLGGSLVEIVVVIADLGDAERALYRRLQELALEERSAL